MSSLSVFNFKENQVRIVLDEQGNPMFVAKDVAIALGYADPTNAIKQHCRGVVKRHPIKDNLNRTQNVRVIYEPDVYALVFGSKLESAITFQNWVFEEVLPTIRKTGEYRITLTVEQQKALADTVRSRCKTNGEHYQTVWHNLKQHFGVERYTDILSADFPRAIQFVKTVELPPMIENHPQQHLLPKETVSKAIDYISAISRLVVELGGTLPKIDLDSEQLALAYAQRLLMGRRMTVSFDEAGQPNLRLIPQQSWIVTNENIANIVSDPCGIDKALLPNIIVSATNRLYPTK